MKIYESALLTLSALALVAPATAQLDEKSSTSILVCRSHQCATASQSMTKGFLFNKLDQMFDQNIGKTVLVCEADPTSHVCLRDGITMSGRSAFSPVDITIRNFKLVDKKMLKGMTGLDLVLDYQMQAGSTFPDCQLGLSRLMVDYTDKVELQTKDFTCNLTETGHTSINASYNINYLDFDYGFIGAYYTIASGEAVLGDRTGYALFRFTAKPTPSNYAFPPPPADAQPTYQNLTKKVELPEIVKDTAPNAIVEEGDEFLIDEEIPLQENNFGTKKEEVKQTQKTQSANGMGPSSDANVTETTVRIVPEFPEQQPVQTSVELQPKVVKTVTVERVLITPDGNRHVTPPKKRTFVDGLEQPVEVKPRKSDKTSVRWEEPEEPYLDERDTSPVAWEGTDEAYPDVPPELPDEVDHEDSLDLMEELP